MIPRLEDIEVNSGQHDQIKQPELTQKSQIDLRYTIDLDIPQKLPQEPKISVFQNLFLDRYRRLSKILIGNLDPDAKIITTPIINKIIDAKYLIFYSPCNIINYICFLYFRIFLIGTIISQIFK